MSDRELKMFEEIVNLPTAPFLEAHVIGYIERFVSARPALELRRDRFGNLWVRYAPPNVRRGRIRPVLFAAHMDHPGFEAGKMVDARRVRADWRGWVPAPYFKGTRVQFHSEGRWVHGVIEEVISNKKGYQRATSSARSFGADAPPAAVIARVRSSVRPGSLGMWRIPDAVRRGDRMMCRVCDDLAGLAGILCMLDILCRRRSKAPCHAFFTRAEEVGFAGALAAVSEKTVPRDALVVAVECSKAITGVAHGDGPVLRVGDKASVFTPSATAYCQVVAEELAQRDKSFRYQRKLMDGGTCESTAYCHYGYEATGICLPLGNYHNVDAKRGRIGPEFVDVNDFLNLVKWFVALAESPLKIQFDGSHPGLGKRLESLLRHHRGRLARTARTVGGA